MDLLGTIATFANLLTALLAFGLIVVIHELGHFLAARWAGIRVLAFAVGFGPALFSWRKGMGFRRGSSEAEYNTRRAAQGKKQVQIGTEMVFVEPKGPDALPGVSPTEYRFNILPLGGYVKMLGQEDANPAAISDEPDSYQRCKPWKRLVVISAGVVANVICAAVLFMIVFLVGLETEPPKIGNAEPGTPAATTTASNADELGVTHPGLQTGDLVLRIGNRKANSFNDIVLASAMAGPNSKIHFLVQRPGVDHPLRFEIQPERSSFTNLFEVGLAPFRSPLILDIPPGEIPQDQLRDSFNKANLPGIEPGMRLVRAGNIDNATSAFALDHAAAQSQGQPFEAVFESPAAGRQVTVQINPVLALEANRVPGDPKRPVLLDHILGMAPVMTVAQVSDGGKEAGLQDGDVFARIGNVEFPNMAQGIAQIRSREPGDTIDIVVLRGQGPILQREEVELKAKVRQDRTVGFNVGSTADTAVMVSKPSDRLLPVRAGEDPFTPAATRFIARPGTIIHSVAGRPVTDFQSLARTLRDVTREAHGRGEGATLELEVTLPVPAADDGSRPGQTITADLTPEEVAALHDLRWRSPVPIGIFEPEQFKLRASNPVEAIGMGLAETTRVMTMTYLTFLRLYQGTVQVEHLKGPVGIAHIGTRVASKGLLWLMFFSALISINLAVINFLPFPIVDGGHAVFIIAEMIRGKPVPVSIQNAAAMAGLAVIVVIFFLITFNDVMNLIG